MAILLRRFNSYLQLTARLGITSLLKAESVSRKSLVLALGFALSAFSIGPVYSSQLPLVNVCDTPPVLGNPENTYTPKPGVGVTTWKFNAGVTHDSWEDTRISVASSSLNLFTWKIGRTLIPGYADPYESVITNDAAVAINSDFFNLYGDPLPWGPALENGKLIYFPLAYDPQTGYTPDWMKIAGVVSRLPDPADGWSTTGSVQLNSRSQIIAGLNLPSLPLDGVVIYDNRRPGGTPVGKVSILVSGNEIIDFDLAGKSYTPTAGQNVIQATGKAARDLRNKFANRGVTIDLGKPESHGFKSKGSITAGSTSAPLSFVNLVGNKTSVFTPLWTGPTPKKDLTWVLSGGKIKKIYKTGSAVSVLSKQTVVQFVNPSNSLKAQKIGSTVKVKYSRPSIKQGFLTHGIARIGASDFSITGINRQQGSNEISLFTSDWKNKTPAGAVTIKIKDGKITGFFNAGRSVKVLAGEYILQVPDSLAPDLRTSYIRPVTTVTVDETAERIKTIAETKARYRSTLTVNGEKLFMGTLNYYLPDNQGGAILPPSNLGSVYDDNWRGSYGDGDTYAGKASIRVRDGVIHRIKKSGGSMSVEEPGDLVFQLGNNQAALVQDWAVGMAATFVSKYQTKNQEPYETFVGYGTKLIIDDSIVATCSNTGNQIRPRTAIGWNDAGQYWLMTASPASRDPNNSGYRTGGANYPQISRWLKSLGATHAVGLDGGGSTWMVRRTTNGAARVDLPEPNNNCQRNQTDMSCNPWIRWVPFELMLVSAAE